MPKEPSNRAIRRRNPPDGFPDGDILSFNIFVAASEEARIWRDAVQRAATDVQKDLDRIRLNVWDYRLHAPLQTKGHVQRDHIDAGMLHIVDAHVAIGLLLKRAGGGTQGEIRAALKPDTGPAVFTYFSEFPITEAHCKTAQLKKAVKDQDTIEAFVAELREMGHAEGEVWYVSTIEWKDADDIPRDLQAQVTRDLKGYVRRWLEEQDVRRKAEHKAQRKPGRKAAGAGTGAGKSRVAASTPASASKAMAEDAYPTYLGLDPYGRKDAPNFFGRSDEIKEYLGIILDTNQQTLLIKGGSGVGKSSLMFAGVLPQLPDTPASKPRNSMFLRPDVDPFHSLARALNVRRIGSKQLHESGLGAYADKLHDDGDLLLRELEESFKTWSRRVLYVDQLEELLIETHTPADLDGKIQLARRLRFVSALRAFLDRDRRNFLIASIRVDYLKLLVPEHWRELADLFKRGSERMLYVPEYGDIERIVMGPAERVGVRVAGNLLKALRTDVKSESSWTPLLSACLKDIVDLVRDDPTFPATRELTLAHYQDVGELNGVIERRAAAAMEGMTEEQQLTLSTLWPLLVRLDAETGIPTRRRFVLHGAGLSAEQVALVNYLIDNRVLVNEGEVEIIHDALLTRWPELRAWIQRYGPDLNELHDFLQRTRVWQQLQLDRKLLSREEVEAATRLLKRHSAWAALHKDVSVMIEASKLAIAYRTFLDALRQDDMLTILATWRGGRLKRPDIDALNDELRPFYYALYPEDIPIESSATAADSAFDAAKSRTTAGPAEWKAYFTGIDLKATTPYSGFTIAHFAAIAGRTELLVVLKDLGADLHAKSKKGNPPFVSACSGDHVETFNWLMAQTPNAVAALTTENVLGQTPLRFAAWTGSTRILTEILRRVPPDIDVDTPDEKGWTPLSTAAYDGHLSFVRGLVEAGRARPRAFVLKSSEFRLLHVVFRQRQWATARFLLDTLSDEDLGLEVETARGETPLSALLGACDGLERMDLTAAVAVLTRLLERGADPNHAAGSPRKPPLFHAITTREWKVVEALLPRADVTVMDNDGRTALHLALAHRQQDIALRLLDDPRTPIHQTDRNGRSPLAFASVAGMETVVRRLIAKGAIDDEVRRDGVLVASTLADEPKVGRRDAGGFRIRERIFKNLLQPVAAPLVRGRIAERLMQAGAPAPRYAELTRDESGRLLGARFDVRVTERALEKTWSGDVAHMPDTIAGAWQLLKPADGAQLLATCVDENIVGTLDLECLQPSAVRRLALPFYDNGALYEIAVRTPRSAIGSASGPASSSATGHGVITLLEAGGKRVRLVGVSTPVHETNSDHLHLRHTADAVEYLKFFCSVVHGDHGAFRILDRELVTYEPKVRSTVKARVRALSGEPKKIAVPEGPDPRPSYAFTCRVLYGTYIFDTKFTVQDNGFIEMPESSPITQGLPVYLEKYLDGVRTLVAVPPDSELRRPDTDTKKE